MTCAIEVKNVYKYRDKPDGSGENRRTAVLCDVSFDVHRGETFALMGPSGSGKTTMLRMLNLLDSCDSGEVHFEERPIGEYQVLDLRRRVGMVFQVPAVFEGTVLDNLAYGPRLAQKEKGWIAEKAGEVIDIVGLNRSYLEREASKLSVGEQQRVSIARALANEPKVLLMDEPTSALDPTASNQILGLIRKLGEKLDLTVVFVTHLPHHAKEVANRGMVIVCGKKIETGEIGELISNPSHEVTKLFFEGRLDSCEIEKIGWETCSN